MTVSEYSRREIANWDGVGHFIMLEAPERFNAALMEFLVKNRFLRN